MTDAVDSVLPERRDSRSRLTMFSASMMASSTTAPRAMTRPARVIVLIVAPRQSSTSRVAMSDSGMVSRLISATRHSKRKSMRMTTTRRKPRTRACERLEIASLTKSACWKTCVSNSTSGSPGCSSAMAFSTPSVSSMVLAHGSFSTTRSMPGSELITASPIRG